jgi:hypothetical protein
MHTKNSSISVGKGAGKCGTMQVSIRDVPGFDLSHVIDVIN